MHPLVVTGDPKLAEACSRLAAVSGLELRVVSAPAEVEVAWLPSPLVLVDADMAASISGLPRRPGVVVVAPRDTARAPDESVWRAAVGIGAEHVIALPEAERWLIDRLAECAGGPSRDGRIIGVLGAVGGAGSSTIAVGLAAAARRRGLATLLVDGDPMGGGLDLPLGAEQIRGARWKDLGEVTGRLAAGSLSGALPQTDGIAVLSWGREGGVPPSPQTWSAVLDAGMRGHDLVIVDLSRNAIAQVPHFVLVVPAAVRAAAACSALLGALGERIAAIAVRSMRGGIDTATLTRALPWSGAVVDIPHAKSVAECAEIGEPMPSADRWAKACDRLLLAVHAQGA